MEKKKKFSLKAVRINNNWTQEEASKLFKVSVDTLQNYETYKTYPDVPIIENIWNFQVRNTRKIVGPTFYALPSLLDLVDFV